MLLSALELPSKTGKPISLLPRRAREFQIYVGMVICCPQTSSLLSVELRGFIAVSVEPSRFQLSPGTVAGNWDLHSTQTTAKLHAVT